MRVVGGVCARIGRLTQLQQDRASGAPRGIWGKPTSMFVFCFFFALTPEDLDYYRTRWFAGGSETKPADMSNGKKRM